jgi:hypothetical protein
MSALGHKRTFAVQNGMSALPPKADINRYDFGFLFRFVLKSQLSNASFAASSALARVAAAPRLCRRAGSIGPSGAHGQCPLYFLS